MILGQHIRITVYVTHRNPERYKFPERIQLDKHLDSEPSYSFIYDYDVDLKDEVVSQGHKNGHKYADSYFYVISSD